MREHSGAEKQMELFCLHVNGKENSRSSFRLCAELFRNSYRGVAALTLLEHSNYLACVESPIELFGRVDAKNREHRSVCIH
jgi:hypothetical protein